ncbi:MAG: tyrosine--tRNA ligase [Deltaproteobacteria bacterium]|nr:tyrosine--tRNA ligase [Deltaproteobacteria bacterium]
MSELSRQLEILRSGTVDVLPEGELERKLTRSLETGRPLRVKLGADPSAPDLHLGHVVVLRKLAQFQELGHQVIFLIGDFTGRIGDPTGRSETRRPLTAEEVAANAETYRAQIFRILDPERTTVRLNSEWMDKMTASDMVRLCGQLTVARMLERDDFAKRTRESRAIGIHEFLYPLVQGYDSVALQADVELGGTDQHFNLLVGREIQKGYGQEPQAVLTMPLLEGLDGRQKMSKSLGNAIAIADPPEESFGKVMSISDVLMVRYAELLSRGMRGLGARLERAEIHPMDAKKALAEELVGQFHGAEAAAAARRHFEQRFQAREDYEPDEVVLESEAQEGLPLFRVVTEIGFARSNSDSRRLIGGRGVRVDGQVAEDALRLLEVGKEHLIAVGRRRLARVRIQAKDVGEAP